MAIKTSLRIIARRLSEAVQKAALKQGIPPDDFALAGTYDEATDRIRLRLGTNHPVDERRLYADAFDEIRRALPEIPHITLHVSLVIHKVTSLEEIYWDSTDSEDEHDLTELLNRS
jgi:hypothetical protein